MPGHPFYGTAAWKAARTACVRRAGFRCEACSASVARRGSSRVDHIKTRREAPELALEPTNLRCLCVGCDAKRHAEKGGSHAPALPPSVDLNGWPTDPQHRWNEREDVTPT